MMMTTTLAAGVVLITLATAAAADESPYRWWLPAHRDAQKSFEAGLNAIPTPAGLRAAHDLTAAEPHVAGTPGDERQIQRLIAEFSKLGLEVERHDFWAYLARPVDAKLEIITPGASPIALPLKETPLAQDPHSAHADLTSGWNAYSASGDVTAEVVYANYGTKEDFEKLRELGIDVAGKIVIARYGQNFRGYKAKFAQAAGAAGLIIYTDPGDSGYAQGPPYPEGGWANDSYIQRGSILTLDYPGDPLTPGEEAAHRAARLDPDEIALPKIPVQPISWGAAQQIMSRLRGKPVPTPSKSPRNWQGGLPFTYRLEGGPDLKVRLMVRQDRALTKSANVIATLRGSTFPEQKIIIGCHHDAWGCGAADPLAGLMLVLESARSFVEMAKQGRVPERSIVFAAWGAEEFGIIGSTEWCEARRDDLAANAIAYLNLDMAAMGPNFSCSASPSLRPLVNDITREVPQAGTKVGRSVRDAWVGEKSASRPNSSDPKAEPAASTVDPQPVFGNLGGGSDHVGFYCHLGVPSCAFGGGGSEGTSYHSSYDTLAWYRKIVGEEYQPALMLTRVINLFAVRLANATILPLDAGEYVAEIRRQLASLQQRAEALAVFVEFSNLERELKSLEEEATATREQILAALAAANITPQKLAAVNRAQLALERQWLDPEGLPGRPWYRNLFAAPDADSGYDVWMLPRLRWGIEQRDSKTAAWTQGAYLDAIQRVGERLAEIRAALEGGAKAGSR